MQGSSLLSVLLSWLLFPVALPATILLLPELTLAQESSASEIDAFTQLAEANHLLQQDIQQYQVSQFRAALQSWQQALEFYQDPVVRSVFLQQSRRGEANTLGNLGEIYRNFGQYRQAIDFYNQGLLVFLEINDRIGEGSVRSNLGIAYANLGQYQEAIDFLEKSLFIAREVGSRHSEGVALSNLGEIYRNLGQYQQAIDFHEQGLIIFREIDNRQSEGAALGNLGADYNSLGQYEQAINFYEQRLVIAREIGDRLGESTALGNLGVSYRNLGQFQEAIALHEQSLAIDREIGNRQGESNSLGNLGNAFLNLGKIQESITFYEQQLSISREISDHQGQGIALNNLGAAHYYLGQISASVNALLEAITIYDTLRAANLPDSEKITFFDTYLKTYLALQRSLVAQNEPEQALVYAEQGRARAFVELLVTRITNSANTNATSLESINGFDLAGIQRVAREQNATLVNYSVISEQSLFTWVVQPTGEIAFRQVDLGDENLPELVSLVRETLGARSQDRATVIAEVPPEEAERRQAQRQQQLQQLHQILIEPIAQSLPTDPNERVVFIPHQDLFLVPFAALVDGNGDYLIENHTILTAPSIQVLDLTAQQAVAQQARTDRPTDLLIVGNPTMPSIWNPQTNQTTQLSNLPGAEREAIAIADTLDADALLSGNASKSAVVAQMPAARVIHLATHGLLEYGTPEDSGVLDVPGAIALAPSANDDGLLTAAEILQMNLNAELVVLSACDTGRGRITGDGVIGLSRAFVTAGVPSLMVSLWAVDDAATAEWMVTFYDQWEQTGDKAQALRQAMLTTLENHPDPRLWAAFTLMGQAE